MLNLKRPWFHGAESPPGRAEVEAALDRSDASALADLQMHWDEAYEIGLDGDIWSARFLGSTDQLRAHTSHELRDLIRTDYTYRQHVARAQGSDGPELEDHDSYSAHYDNGIDDDAPAPQPRAKYAEIRGERMST
jgi:hypothetical protein